MALLGHNAIPAAGSRKTCSQCGRVGTRGFVTTEEAKVTWPGEGVATIPPITFCANTAACRKRWPRDNDDE